MLEVAAPAEPGAGYRAPGRHPVRAGLEDLHRIPAPEAAWLSSVIWTITRSPGSVCRTKITRPSCRATQ